MENSLVEIAAKFQEDKHLLGECVQIGSLVTVVLRS
jgi:hypothetical protein